MSEKLKYYDAARRDVKIDSTPSRYQDGTYKWSNGQENILNQAQFNELRTYKTEISKLETKKETLTREMLMYQNPVKYLENEGEVLVKVWQTEIDDEQLILNGLRTDLKQFDEDMSNRGLFLEEEEENPKSTITPQKSGINWKAVFSFIGIWLVGEIFMTYVQWNALRDEKGIEDLVVRSLSFAVTLFLLHYVAYKNKKSPRVIYYVYMGFNLIMLLTMLFAPLIISKLYPVDGQAPSIQDEWSLTETVNHANGAVSEYPFWVEFYRSYEVIPAILSFLFYLAMVSLMISKPEEPPVPSPEPKPETEQDKKKKDRKHFKARINESENRLDDLRNKLNASLTPNTAHINNVLEKLENAKKEILAAGSRIKELKTKIEVLYKAVEMELNLYRTDYQDILRNDPIKSQSVKPEWPNRNDIVQHFII